MHRLARMPTHFEPTLGDKIETPVRFAGTNPNLGARYDTDMSKLPPRSKKAKAQFYVHRDATKLPNPWGDDLDRMTVTRHDMTKSTYPPDYLQAVDRTKRDRVVPHVDLLHSHRVDAFRYMVESLAPAGFDPVYPGTSVSLGAVEEYRDRVKRAIDGWNEPNSYMFLDEASVFKPKTLNDGLDDLLANTRHKPKMQAKERQEKLDRMAMREWSDDYLNQLVKLNTPMKKSAQDELDRRAMNAPGESMKPHPSLALDLTMTQYGENLLAEFESAYDGGNCSCHLSPPCGSCTHEGNPSNLEGGTEREHGIWMSTLEAKQHPSYVKANSQAEYSFSKTVTDDFGDRTVIMPSARQAGKSWAKKMRDW